MQFGYLGLQTLYDRYFLIDHYAGGRRFELPQCFFMRVAMGLALNEKASLSIGYDHSSIARMRSVRRSPVMSCSTSTARARSRSSPDATG